VWYDKRPKGRAGFTLVELLAAMVIAGILATTAYRLVQNQSRFVAVQSAREEVQQNSRGALDVVSAELRTANPGGIVDATGTQLTLMLPRAWGVVCDAGTGSTSMSVIFPSIPADLVPAGNGAGVMVDTGPLDAASPTWEPSPPDADAADRATVSAAAAINLSASGNVCEGAGFGAGAGAALAAAYTLTGTNFPSGRERGSLVMLYQLVRYNVTSDGGRSWLYRSSGMDGDNFTMQPLAGPVDSIRFAYFADNATARLTSTTLNATERASLSRIQIKVATVSRSSVGGRYQRETDSVTVQLRNRTRNLTP